MYSIGKNHLYHMRIEIWHWTVEKKHVAHTHAKKSKPISMHWKIEA